MELKRQFERGKRLRAILNTFFAVSFLVLALMGGVGCASTGTAGAPVWWDNPQQHGARHLYFKAMGESKESLEAARSSALQSSWSSQHNRRGGGTPPPNATDTIRQSVPSNSLCRVRWCSDRKAGKLNKICDRVGIVCIGAVAPLRLEEFRMASGESLGLATRNQMRVGFRVKCRI